MNTNLYPQLNRISLFRRTTLLGVAALLVFCMSVYVPGAPVKVTVVLAIVAVLALGRRIWSIAVLPLLALLAYGAAVTIIFPGPKPDLSGVLQFPLFSLDCVLLCTLCLQNRSLRAQYFVMFGILAVTAVGAAGDLLGHDMTAMLPFGMPSDDYFDAVTTVGDAVRVRGFFPESGVLGAVALSMSTCAGLGCLALLSASRRRRVAALALVCSGVLGLAFICLTVTKSGAATAGMAMLGFLAAFGISRRLSHRLVAFGGAAAAILGVALFLFVAPTGISSYMKGEAGTFVDLQQGNMAGLAGQGGMLTRIECWKLALSSVRYYPLGVGAYGHESVLAKDTPVRLTGEMRFFFDRGIFGLKNALANIMAETGLVGVFLLAFWMWKNLLSPARRLLKSNSRGAVPLAGLYIGSALCSVAFLFSCEIYPFLALLLLLKYHADAVGQEWTKSVAKEAEEAFGEEWDGLGTAMVPAQS